MRTIIPITKINNLDELKTSKINNIAQQPEVPFKSLFVDALNNAKASELELQQEINKVVTGEPDDLHNVNIASTNAALSLEMVVQLRNKALDAYNTIMQMGV